MGFQLCPICREYRCVLLSNSGCSHSVCEECWARWAESQIPRCHAERQEVVPCFSPYCERDISSALWRHIGTLSQTVNEFQDLPVVVQRRRLRSNVLYPRAVQVDCPSPDCWGLGYLGFDTVMCFICEHQW